MVPNMKCFEDLTDLDLKGNILEIAGKSLSVEVTTCKGHDYCRSEEEIDQFVATHTLFTIFNQQVYNTEGYGDEATIIN